MSIAAQNVCRWYLLLIACIGVCSIVLLFKYLLKYFGSGQRHCIMVLNSYYLQGPVHGRIIWGLNEHAWACYLIKDRSIPGSSSFLLYTHCSTLCCTLWYADKVTWEITHHRQTHHTSTHIQREYSELRDRCKVYVWLSFYSFPPPILIPLLNILIRGPWLVLHLDAHLAWILSNWPILTPICYNNPTPIWYDNLLEKNAFSAKYCLTGWMNPVLLKARKWTSLCWIIIFEHSLAWQFMAGSSIKESHIQCNTTVTHTQHHSCTDYPQISTKKGHLCCWL